MKPISDSRREFLTRVTDQYLEHADQAEDYIMATRGLSATQAAYYRLGVVVDPPDDHWRFKGRLAIPYVTRSGVVAMKFRCMEDHDCGDNGHEKYLGESGGLVTLFNVRSLHIESSTIAICEGEMDAIVVEQLVGIPAVGYPGASQWKSNRFWRRCFAGYDKVYVVADGDDAGATSAEAIMADLPNATLVMMPDKMDASSVAVGDDGAEHLRKKMGR